MIPPSLHFKKSNPKIEFNSSPFYVNAKLAEWRADTSPRRAGRQLLWYRRAPNVHIILEEPPIQPSSKKSRTRQLVTISASNAKGLKRLRLDLSNHLSNHPEFLLADVAYTLHKGKKGTSLSRSLCK